MRTVPGLSDPLKDVWVSACVTAATLLGFFVASEPTRHPFVIPAAACGAIVGIDAVKWLRGRLDPFDPRGIVGLLGWHFFFLAPMLHVAWGYWMPYVQAPADWRDWLGAMGCLNVLGLIVYRITLARMLSLPAILGRSAWRLDPSRFPIVLGIALMVTAMAQVWVYASYGGIGGFVSEYEADQERAFGGMGPVFLVSEAFPILAAFGAVVMLRGRRPSWMLVVLGLAGFLALKMVFGGLRGSRSSTVWALFWAAGVVHFSVRPIPRRMIGVGILFLLGFLYAYGFYKNFGTAAIEALDGDEVRSAMAETSNRSMATAVLADLGRADVQAFVLHRVADPSSGGDCLYARGGTYLATFCLFIPRSIWPDRPEGKVRSGTEALYGTTTAALGTMRASQVYGLAGEAMLNFGPVAVPPSYAVLGIVVAGVVRLGKAWGPGDSRRWMLPFLVNFAFVVLVSDSDNLLFFLVKDGAIPAAVVTLGSRRSPSNPEAP